MESLTPTLVLLRRAQASPGFVAFASILGQRARGGRSWEAFLMLDELGAPAELANKILEDWPTTLTPRIATLCRELGMELDLGDLEVLQLARHIDDLSRYDWPLLLDRVTRRVEAEKGSRSAAAGAEG